MPETDSERELVLSAEVSEWLFYTRFWEYISEACGTSFAQYEEEVLSRNSIPVALDALDKIKGGLSANPVQEVKFLYGWNDRREELFYTIKCEDILLEIVRLEGYFLDALTMSADVYCQL
ncbi:hypothetical protein [Ralstonia solanacearum]|uniref:hypothetical protein n=1 Tax=Ralstonia solanacearum TaxID=305 RepID=UPI0006DC5843|nr:hypothetical protein [Ralstonia solanacearum]